MERSSTRNCKLTTSFARNLGKGALRAGCLAIFGLSLSGYGAADASAAQAIRGTKTVDEVSYVLAGPAGAKGRNNPSNNALVLETVRPGEVLAVHGERNGWVSVEAPGGVPVWVYGKYLRAVGGVEGPSVYEVTGNNVFQRPRPSSDTSSFPLRQKLFVRDRVNMIARNDSSKPFAEDWIQVRSVPGTLVWVNTSEVQSLPAGRNGASLWGEAVLEKQRKIAAVGQLPGKTKLGTAKDSAAIAGSESGVTDAAATAEPVVLDEATASTLASIVKQLDEKFAIEKAAEQPDFAPISAAYSKILERTSGSAIGATVQSRLLEVQALQSAWELRQEIINSRADHERALQERESKLREASNMRDPLANRYVSRGWLEEIELDTGEKLHVLRFGGGFIAELHCLSGRYDLSVFEGFELGVRGVPMAGTLSATDAFQEGAQRIDVQRIEVLAGRRLLK